MAKIPPVPPVEPPPPVVKVDETVMHIVSLQFPGGRVRLAEARRGDITALVELQASARLDVDDARAWAIYYKAVADSILSVNS